MLARSMFLGNTLAQLARRPTRSLRLPSVRFAPTRRCFNDLDLIRRLELDAIKFKHFVFEVQRAYLPRNQYHNAAHGADVLQTIHYFMTTGGSVGP